VDRLSADYSALREVVARLDSRDVIRCANPGDRVELGTQFVRCGQATVGVENLDRGRNTARVAIIAYGFRDTQTTRLDVSQKFVTACHWVNGLATGTTFDIPDLLASAPNLNDTDVRLLLGLFERAYLVRRLEVSVDVGRIDAV